VDSFFPQYTPQSYVSSSSSLPATPPHSLWCRPCGPILCPAWLTMLAVDTPLSTPTHSYFIPLHPASACYTLLCSSWNNTPPIPTLFASHGFMGNNTHRCDECYLLLRSNEFFGRRGLTSPPCPNTRISPPSGSGSVMIIITYRMASIPSPKFCLSLLIP
jgi:hypothetical protein